MSQISAVIVLTYMTRFTILNHMNFLIASFAAATVFFRCL